MRNTKLIITIISFLFSVNIHSQVKRYLSDYSMKIKIEKEVSLHSGTAEEISIENVYIIHDTIKSTVDVKYVEDDKRISFFTNVTYSESFTDKLDNQYVAYTAVRNKVPYFISFSRDIIKFDNRVTYISVAYHIKNL